MSQQQIAPLSELVEKWNEVIDHPDLPKITEIHKRKTLAACLENTLVESQRERAAAGYIVETAPTNATGSAISNYDPMLISLLRRAVPQLLAYDLVGTQPMTGPTGMIFALRSRYTSQTGSETFFSEVDTSFTGANTSTHSGTDPVANTDVNYAGYTYGTTMPTANAEALGSTNAQAWSEMSFSIEKVTITAGSRALKAEYSQELAQDLKAIHGLDAEQELSNILTTELIAEINREIVRTIYNAAVPGAQTGTTTAGVFDLDTDSNGRWSVEKFKGLVFQLERERNAIAKGTRRGRGNIILVSSDVASALAMTGVLSYTPNYNANLTVDDTGNTFAGTLHNGQVKVFIDPYYSSSAGFELAVAGYKGSSSYDAGIYYAPYVPLQMVRAVDPNTFQPKIGFKTRYAMAANPFAEGLSKQANPTTGVINKRKNQYYRIFAVKNLM